MSLNLQKTADAIKLNLSKKGVANPPQAEVCFVLDVSGSFDGFHSNGTTQKLMDKLVPWAMVLDPDKKLDVVTFGTNAHHCGTVDTTSFDHDYIRNSIVERVPNYNGGTNYAPAIKTCLDIFGWTPASQLDKVTGGLKGFWNRVTKAQPTVATTPAEQRRSIVLFVTDGDNGDKDETMRLLEESEKRGDQVYFLLVGVGHSHFSFLERMADKFSNTGFVKVSDINAFTKQTDDQISDAFIGQELVDWLKK